MIRLLNSFFEFLFLPFRDVDPTWGMLVISVIAGILMLLVFKATSDQSGIRRAKNLVKGHFLAIRLYRDDIGLMFDTMKQILLSNLFYMKKSVRPMLFLVVPVGLLLVQLGSRYDHRPFRVGESIVVSLRLDPNRQDVSLNDIELEFPSGLEIDMPPVRIEPLREINWRLLARQPGSYELTLKVNEAIMTKRVEVTDRLRPLSRQVRRGGLWAAVMNPVEGTLPRSSPVLSIVIRYPKREFDLAGLQMHWIVAFLGLSLLSAFSFRRAFGVEL